MLRESSTSTAIMFCCEVSSATVIAGSHSSTSTSAISAASNPQITPPRQLLNLGPPATRRAHINHPSPPVQATISSTSTHPGHRPSRTKWPFKKLVSGYLKKNSNIQKNQPHLSKEAFVTNQQPATNNHQPAVSASSHTPHNSALRETPSKRTPPDTQDRPPTPTRHPGAC